MQSETLQDVYEFASMFARQKGASHLECRHVLYAMSVVDNEAKRFLTDFGLNEQNLEPKAKGRGGVLTDSPEITYLNASAATIAEVMGDNDEKHLRLQQIGILAGRTGQRRKQAVKPHCIQHQKRR